ncbi:MAG: heterodisulfide reductase subunit B [Desulfobacteraceae bacterium]|nr:MAG: heterodisulfide reductase subunit B [Desulfobacteraceae bacterium]
MTYGFYPGCAYKTEAVYKHSVEAVCRVIGLELVTINDWNCCGATSIFSLDQMDGLVLTGRIFALAARQKLDTIITTCNACYTTLRKASKTFKTEPELTRRVNERLAIEGLAITTLPPVRHLLDVWSHDIDEALWSRKRAANFKPMKVASYYGCQLTRPWADIDDPEHPQIMDNFIARLGYEPVEHGAKTVCCGASHFITYEDSCRTLCERIVNEIKRKGGQAISTLCPLCQINIDAVQEKQRGPSLPVPYFTQLAGLSLGLPPSILGMDKLLTPMQTAGLKF